jgi:hypothetical protein
MWLFVKNGFLSIVQHRDQPDMLIVRARVRGDIEHYFPKAKVERTEDHDYLYRAVLPKHQVATRLFDAVLDIDYPKFKPAVTDKRRQAYYFDIWDTGYSMQEELSQVRGRHK